MSRYTQTLSMPTNGEDLASYRWSSWSATAWYRSLSSWTSFFCLGRSAQYSSKLFCTALQLCSASLRLRFSFSKLSSCFTKSRISFCERKRPSVQNSNFISTCGLKKNLPKSQSDCFPRSFGLEVPSLFLLSGRRLVWRWAEMKSQVLYCNLIANQCVERKKRTNK